MRLRLLCVCVLLAVAGCQPTPVKSTPEPAAARFPDYRPKMSPDTVWDFRPALAATFTSLPAAKLSALAQLLKGLDEAKQQAAASPGRWTEGAVYLGADPKQYEPSGPELRVAEIGDRIRRVAAHADAAELRRAMSEAGITAAEVEYSRFDFRHVDVMGSGRFTYASSPKRTRVRLKKE